VVQHHEVAVRFEPGPAQMKGPGQTGLTGAYDDYLDLACAVHAAVNSTGAGHLPGASGWCVRARARWDRMGDMSDAFTTRVLHIASGSEETVVDLTRDCEAFLGEAAAGRDGLLNVFVPHATAGIAIIETGAGSDDDLLTALHTLLPADDRWQHRHGSPGHGRDHVLPAIVPPHATLPVLNGRLELGTWQSVCLVDTNRDNPDRQVRLSFLAGS
jgi:secondary thiamine-phosphate synthase enzyme